MSGRRRQAPQYQELGEMFNPQFPVQPRPEGHVARMILTALFVSSLALGALIGVGVWRSTHQVIHRNSQLHQLQQLEIDLERLINDIRNLSATDMDKNCTFVIGQNLTQTTRFADDQFLVYDTAAPNIIQLQLNASELALMQTVVWTPQNRSGTVLSLENTIDAQSVFFDDQFTLLTGEGVDNSSVLMFDVSGVSSLTTRTLSFPAADGTIALTIDIPTFSSVFFDNAFTIVSPSTTSPTKRLALDCAGISSATTRTLIVPDKDCVVAYVDEQTNGTAPPFSDAEFNLYAQSDPSAGARFDLAALGTGESVVMSVQDGIAGSSHTIAYLANIVQIVEVTINSSRQFPDLAHEGVSSLSGLGVITHIELSFCGGGGGACTSGGGGGGSASSLVDFVILQPNDKFDQFNITLGAGGDSRNDTGQGGTGGTTTVLGISSTGFYLDLNAYGGEGGYCINYAANTSFEQAGGGGGGSGAAASGIYPGGAGTLGGVSGSRGIIAADGCDVSAFPIPSEFRFPWFSGGGGNQAANPNCTQRDLGQQGGRAWLDIGSSLSPPAGAPGYFGTTNLASETLAGACAGATATSSGSTGATGGPGIAVIRYFVR